LNLSLEDVARNPGPDYAVDVDPVSDFDFGISNHSSSSFFDEPNIATNSTPFDNTSLSSELEYCRSVLSQQSSLFNSEIISQFHDQDTSYQQQLVGTSQDQPLSIYHEPLRVPLYRLPLLKCPQCQEGFVDKRQLK